MAVSYDTDNEARSSGAGTTVSVTLTVASNADRCLVALVGLGDFPSAQNVSAVEYTAGSGGTWTYVGRRSNGENNVEIWTSTAPSTGSVTVRASVASTTGASADRYICVISLYGVDQTTPADAFTSGTTGGALSVTSDADGMAVCEVMHNTSPGDVTGGATQVASDVNNYHWRAAYFVSSPTATFTWSASTAIAGCNINAAVAAPTVTIMGASVM